MYLKGVLFVNSRFAKGVPFLLKMVSKTFNRLRGWTPVRSHGWNHGFPKFETWPSALLRDNQKTRIIWGKSDCFCDQRMWKELNKIGKPHFSKVCVSSFLSGLIRSRFYGSRRNLFIVSINGRESAREPCTQERRSTQPFKSCSNPFAFVGYRNNHFSSI